MKRLSIVCLSILFLAFGASGAMATSVLYDWAFNVDGTISEDSAGDLMPTTGALDSEGLGTLTWITSVAGNHSFLAFFDYEIDEVVNTYFNEYGATTGTPESVAAGDDGDQSWEIDEPWNGNIYNNVVTAGSLDNTNAVPQLTPNDVSWAMGWNFSMAAGETATIRLVLGDTAPVSGFYLSHTDPETGTVGIDYSPEQSIYFSSTLDIQGGGPAPVPEPSTILLVGTGLIGILGFGRKKLSKT